MKILFSLLFLSVMVVSAHSQDSVKENTEVKRIPLNSNDSEVRQNFSAVESKINIAKVKEEVTKRNIKANLSSIYENKSKAPFFPREFQKQNIRRNKFYENQTPEDDEKSKKIGEYKIDRRAKWEIEGGSTEYGAEIGFAPDIATWISGPKPWDISGHRHFLGSFRYGKILGTRGIVTFSYAIEFIPISLAIGNETENKEFRTNPNVPPTKRTTNYGLALNPTSFRFIFFPKFRLRPFLFAGLGPSYHFKPVPIPSGTKWNLQFDFGIGGQYMLSKTKAIQFGYRYYHLSNVYLSNYNPGYNTNIFFFGYSVFKK